MSLGLAEEDGFVGLPAGLLVLVRLLVLGVLETVLAGVLLVPEAADLGCVAVRRAG